MAGWTERLGLEPGTRRRDVAIAVVCLLGGMAMSALGGYRGLITEPAPLLAQAVPLAVICGAVTLRRVAPVLGLAIGTAGLAGDLALGGTLSAILVYTQVLYDACVYGPARLWPWLLRASVALTAAGGVVGVALTREWRGLGLAVPLALGLVLPVVTGISVRQYRDRAEAERRNAIVEERHRMARELHDVIANHLSAVALNATAALSVPDLDQTKVTAVLGLIRENSVQGLAELRRLVGLLREGAEDPLRHGLADLPALVEQARDGGLAVSLRSTGEPVTLPVDVDLAAYRIVQESLTNARKHGAGPAVVELLFDFPYLSIAVDNPMGSGSPLPGSGAGLVGMRERAEMLDGEFSAGRDGSHWRVRARLPLGETS